jgi:hypothetical protein
MVAAQAPGVPGWTRVVRGREPTKR